MNWHEIFTYSTGELLWKELPSRCVETNKRCAGKPVCGARERGYRRVVVSGKSYRVHRIIWEMHHGPIPEKLVIDHINGNPSDNRIENLRLATHAENMRNMKMHNTLGVKGVYRHKKKYMSTIRTNGVSRYLGVYDTIEEAHAAYKIAAQELHGEFARTI